MILQTALMPHQLPAVNKLRPLRVGALFMEMGLGKSRTVIELASNKAAAGKIDRVLWFCPVSLKETTRQEIHKHVASATVNVFDHKTEAGKIPAAEWHVIGLESLSSSDRVYLAALSLVDDRTFVIVDESSYIKGHDSNRTLRATKIAATARYRFILTGTPITQGVVDLYAQFKFLDTRILGYKSFHQFEANHLEYSDRYPGMIVRSHNTAWLAAKIAPYTYQITKKECLPLPEKIHTTRYFTMTLDQRSAYEQAKSEAFDDIADDDDISSTVIFRLFTVLQQIVCGFWNRRDPDDWDDQQVIEFEHDRLKQLVATIAEIGDAEKVIIFAKYRRDVRAIAAALRQQHGESCAALFFGDLTPAERNEDLQRFRATARFFIATQDCGGHGLTLNESCKVIFYNNQFKFASRLQAEDRNHRIGQTRDVTYIDLVCSDSIDERIQRCLAKKADVVEEFKAEVAKLREKRTFREAVKVAINQL